MSAVDINGTVLSVNDTVVVQYMTVARIDGPNKVFLHSPDGRTVYVGDSTKLEKLDASVKAQKQSGDQATSAAQAAATAAQALAAAAVPAPAGTIICIKTGTAVPTGWAVCDGQNGTLNLTLSFLVGTRYIQKL